MKKKSYADRGKIGDFYHYNIHNPIYFFWWKQLRPRLKGYKPLMSDNRYRKIAKRLQEMKFGQLVLGAFFFIINMTTMLKVFDAPAWVYMVALPFTGFMVWFVGHWLEKHNVRKYFREEEFKDVRLK